MGHNKGMIFKNEIGVIIALAALIIFFWLTSDVFMTSRNWLNILRQVSLLGIMSVGMTKVIVSGEFDLSVGSVFGLSAMLTGTFMQTGLPIWLSIAAGLAVGLAVGFANGFLVTYTQIPSFIVTLGMLNVARGIALVVTGGLVVVLDETTVSAFGDLERFFHYGGGGKVGTVPIMIFYFAIVAVLGYFVLHKTMIGFRMKAVGGNANAARVVGINVNTVKITAFCILGLLSALAGIVNLAFITNAQGTTGQGMELNVIAATVIGGTSIAGGKGSILGTVIGVLIMGVLNNGLVLIGVSTFVQTICVGGVIIGAVAIDVWAKKNN
ncbi:MAG: ABC transporter permease [Clostridiales bacterium]|nr:ABC transporter permease [Clostridiales bacterium]